MKINEVFTQNRAQSNAVIYYFAYGMLCDPRNMDYPGAQLIGAAVLPNFKLELLTHANIVAKNGTKVIGALWQINQSILENLDVVEGYPDYYTRISVDVTSKGKTYSAQVYVMTPRSRNIHQGGAAGQAYVESIYDGYEYAGIPVEQLFDAIDEHNDRLEQLVRRREY